MTPVLPVWMPIQNPDTGAHVHAHVHSLDPLKFSYTRPYLAKPRRTIETWPSASPIMAKHKTPLPWPVGSSSVIFRHFSFFSQVQQAYWMKVPSYRRQKTCI